MSRIQDIDYLAVAAPLVVALTALLVLVLDALLPAARRAVSGWLALAGLATAGALLLPLVDDPRRTFCVGGRGLTLEACSYVVDDLTLVFQGLVVVGAVVVVLLSLDTVRDDRLPSGEYFFLLLCSVSGALTLAASRDVLTLVVALEVVSLPAFALVALRRDDPRSGEAGLKLFLVSVVSTAVMLFGLSLVYGVTGQVHLERIATALDATEGQRGEAALLLGVTLALAGFGFKVAAVPFHFWAPDAYQGAPVPVAAYLSVVSKAAGFVGPRPAADERVRALRRRLGTRRRGRRRADHDRRQPRRAAAAARRAAAWPGRRWRSRATCWCRWAPRRSARWTTCCPPPSPTSWRTRS